MLYFSSRYFVSTCIVTFLSINVIIAATGDAKKFNDYQPCESENCRKAAMQISAHLDSSIEPCDDFYGHVCNKWSDRYDFNDKDVVEQLDVLEMKKKDLMLRWLQGVIDRKEDGDNPTERLLVDYYRSCQDLDELERKGLSPLQTIIADNGGWPVIIPDNVWNLTKSLFPLKKIHENYSKIMERGAIFHFGVYPDSSNGTHLLHILPREWEPVTYDNQSVQGRSRRSQDEEFSHRVYVKKVAKALAKSQGIHLANEKIMEDADGIVDLYDSLVELYSTVPRYETGVGHKYTIRTIAEVQRMWDRKMAEKSEYAINWLEAVQSAFVGTGIRINETDNIALSPETIIDELADVLKKFSLRTVVNYVHWMAISGLVQYTNKQMRRYFYKFDGYDNDEPFQLAGRREICYDYNKMDHAMNYAFVQHFYPKRRRTVVREVVENINEIMKKKIEGSSRIDPELKIRSIKKLDIMAKNVGYPVWYDEPGKMDEYHRGLEFSRRDYLKNVVRYIKFEKRKQLMKLRQPYDRLEAELDHVPQGFDAVNFQMPFYHVERPPIMGYGVIGSLVGPALALGFMNEAEIATKIDNSTGSPKNTFIDRISDKVDCLKDQFETKVLDDRTNLKDIIAGYIGWSAVLEAYSSFKEKNNLTEIREYPLHNYSNDQIFFYVLTNRLCVGSYIVGNDRLDGRIPIQDRINVPLSNIEAFSKAFECPLGKTMNPEKKCRFFDEN